ncbi:hypothetical protein COO59_10860 [Mixta theicola]|uniref:Uncharacterized protein n=1 Tax=Mixta theicola TaxID=1458355 RepID=A0A2K1Q914_9GAMM|nr:hypothetical protein COO59_10860 [Mixta theicola]
MLTDTLRGWRLKQPFGEAYLILRHDFSLSRAARLAGKGLFGSDGVHQKLVLPTRQNVIEK